MSCIEHYIKDAENIFSEINVRQKHAQDNAYREYLAARTIQRWFRGFITRKHIAYLNQCATRIQKHWRGYTDRKYYSKLLVIAVHKLFWNHYNLMATKIQKVWRGHYIRSHVFSYYQLKAEINDILHKNAEFRENAEEYCRYTENEAEKQRQQECQDWLNSLNFKLHHLIRTHQIEGVFSNHGTVQYSEIEKHLKSIKFTEYMKNKHKITAKQINGKPDSTDYIFEGRLQECEQAWMDRNKDAKYGLGTGVYGLDNEENQRKQKVKEKLHRLHNKPLRFGIIRYQDKGIKLDDKKYECSQFHRSVKKENHSV